MEQKTYTIYVHINKLNNKCYVGQTCQAVAKRWKNGAGYLDGSQPKFENAIKKYGWANFEHKIIYTNLTLEEANKLEKELIKQYDSINNGYNISSGGDGNPGHKLSEEARAKISRAKLGKPNYKLRGIKRSEQTKAKLREANKGQKPWNKGIKASEEHKIKALNGTLAAIAAGKIVKKVLCIELNKVYNSLTEASKNLNIPCCNISLCVNGKRQTAGGYHWTYYKE